MISWIWTSDFDMVFRLLVCRLARPGDWLMTLLAVNSILLLVTVTVLRLSSLSLISYKQSFPGLPKHLACQSSLFKLSLVSLSWKELS